MDLGFGEGCTGGGGREGTLVGSKVWGGVGEGGHTDWVYTRYSMWGVQSNANHMGMLGAKCSVYS